MGKTAKRDQAAYRANRSRGSEYPEKIPQRFARAGRRLRFDRLKEFIIAYWFKDKNEAILFFKELKPRIFCHLIYYRKVYNIEMHRPVACVETQKEYLKKKLDVIQDFNDKVLDFYRYYRSGATHLDAAYFVRGKPDTEQYLETFYYERDPQFSTNADFKVAKIMANDMLQAYLLSELEALDTTGCFNNGKNKWVNYTINTSAGNVLI